MNYLNLVSLVFTLSGSITDEARAALQEKSVKYVESDEVISFTTAVVSPFMPIMVGNIAITQVHKVLGDHAPGVFPTFTALHVERLEPVAA